jgi:hypothetical protein
LSDDELEALDVVAAAHFTSRSGALRAGLGLLTRPATPMGVDEVVALLATHARPGSLKALTLLARSYGLHRGLLTSQAVGAPYDAALAEVDAIYDRNRARAEDAEWLVDGESREMLDELAARRELGPGAT